jgi:ATP-binding cassette subfamily B protein
MTATRVPETTIPTPTGLLSRLTRSGPWQVFAILPRADRALAVIWWTILVLRAVLPSIIAVLTGVLVGAITAGTGLLPALTGLSVAFVLWQVLPQLHTAVSMNLGSKVSALLSDRLSAACVAPPGIGHLEDPSLASDLTAARDFDRGVTGPPMFMNIDFISGSLTQLMVGVVSAITLFAYSWWAPIVLVAAWSSTHWLLRESGIWKDRNTEPVKLARQHSEYAFQLAMQPQSAKEVRLFGLQDWILERFTRRRHELFDLQYAATRLREKSVAGAFTVVLAANLFVFGVLGWQAVSGAIGLDRVVIMAQLAIGVQFIAFGGLSWAMDDAMAPVLAVGSLERTIPPAGALTLGNRTPADRAGIGLTIRGLEFSYPRTTTAIYDGLDLDIAPGEALAVVGSNGAGKTTLAKLLCRFYEPGAGTIAADGIDLRELDVDAWRTRVTAVFQDLLRLELPLRDNVDPGRLATDDQVLAALHDAGAENLATLDTPLAKGYPGGTELSGGQWQRVALARALCAVRRGAGLVLLDEPTANLDVRGEATIFARLLAEIHAARTEGGTGATAILISHRFSTVRMADRIAVLTKGRVTELGTHDELMAADGRYRRMFDLQASRFDAGLSDDVADEEGVDHDSLG